MLATQAREAGCEAHCLPIEPDDPERIARAVKAAVTGCDLLIIVAGSSAGRDDYTARVVAEQGTLAVHGVAVRPGHPVVLGVVGRHPRAWRAGLSRVGRADLRHLRRAAARRADGRTAPQAPAGHRPAGPQARLPARPGRLGAGTARGRGRHHGRDPAAARRRGADLAGPCRRAAGRPGRARGPPRGRAGRHRTAARHRRDRPHDRGHRLPRPGPRSGRLGAARRGSQPHAGVVERRLAGRPGGPARRAVPPGRLSPAGSGHRRVHPALPGPRYGFPGRRRRVRGPPGAPRPGPDGRAGQPARARAGSAT